MQHRSPTRALALLLLAAAPLATLSGCASASSGTAASAPSTAAAESWPRTIEFDGGTVTVESEPQRIVALSTDVADVAMQLVDVSRIASVPELSRDENQSLNAGTAEEVEGAVSSAAEANAEDVLAYDPDLVLVTTRHDGEQDAFEQLEQAGVPVLAITNGWDSPEVYADNVELIGRALGAEDEAGDLVDDYNTRWQTVTDALSGLSDDDKPSAAQLRIIAGNIYYSGPGSINQAVLEAAGATLASEKIGLEKSQKAELEQLVESSPDRLVLLDSTGEGESQYEDFLSNAALEAVPAVADDQILVLSSADMSSGSGGITALEKIAAWLHPDLVTA